MSSLGPVAGGAWGLAQATGLADMIGEALGLQRDEWTMEIADQPPNRFPAPEGLDLFRSGIPPEDVSWRMRTRVGTIDSMGEYGPVTLPAGAKPIAVSLKAEFGTDHAWEDLRPVRRFLEFCMTKDPLLGRVPAVWFTYADESHLVWVEDLHIKQPHGIWPLTGNPRGYVFTLDMTVARGREYDVTDGAALEPSTVHRVMGQGQTPESVARELYGDPMLGVLVRQWDKNTHSPAPVLGDTVGFPPSGHSALRGSVRPAGIGFLDADGLDRFGDLFEDRWDDGGTAWESWPEEMRT
jgi:hypothetical protein